MKVLVTGGAGFIGSHIVDRMLQADMNVYVLDNLSTGSFNNISSGIKFLKKDIRDQDIKDLFIREKFDYVIHQAAQTTVANSLRDPYYDCEVNILGLVNILEASRLTGVKRVVFASSAAVYGDTPALPISEEIAKNPTSFYGESKLVGERYLDMYYKNFGLEYVALRYANVYGERQSDGGEGGVISIFAKKILSASPFTVYGDGNQTRDFIYVRDVAAANYQALFSSGTNRILNVSTAMETSVNDLIELMSQITPNKLDVAYKAIRDGDIQRSVLNNQAAKFELKWRPQYTLKEGLATMLSDMKRDIHINLKLIWCNNQKG